MALLISTASCSLFVGDDLAKEDSRPAQLNDSGSDADLDGSLDRDGTGSTDSAPLGPTFIGSRLFLDAGANPQVQGPAGVKPGDVLLVIWRIGGFTNPLPSGWTSLGTGSGVGVNGQSGYAFGYHVLEANEDESTTYDFTTQFAGSGLGFAAFRGARQNQPVTPIAIGPLAVDGSNAFDAAAFDARGTTLAVYMFGTMMGVGFPDVPGLQKLEANADFGIYCGASSVAGSTPVAGPHFQLTSPYGGLYQVAGASLGIVAP